MHPIITEQKDDFVKAIAHLQNELQGIRGNRAHPSLVEEIIIEAYGNEMRLKEMASITVPEPRTLQVQPWDKSVLKDVERGLTKADLGVGIKNDGVLLHLSLPPLTAESRSELIKVLGQKLENGRVQIRQVREKIRERIVAAEKAKELSEDDRYAAQQDVDEVVRKYLEEIKALGEAKEKEITTV